MTATADRAALAAAVDRRLRDMRVSGNVAAISRASGVSEATWRKVLNGERVTRADRLRLICDYLGWEDRSIEDVLAGGEPTVRSPASLEDLAVSGYSTHRDGQPITMPAGLGAQLVELGKVLQQAGVRFAQIDGTLENHEGRIGGLEALHRQHHAASGALEDLAAVRSQLEDHRHEHTSRQDAEPERRRR